LIVEAFIQKVAFSPEEAAYLANLEFEAFVRKIAGKPIAIQRIQRSHWYGPDQIPDMGELYFYRIRMRVSGEPAALEQATGWRASAHEEQT
jgi:hypothetical protein